MNDTEPHARVIGMCGRSPLYDMPPSTLYNTGDTILDRKGSFTVGDVLEWYADTNSNIAFGPKWKTATSVDTAKGVVVFTDTADAYIQISGYVRTDRVGITSFSLGDYVGVSNGSMVIVNDPDVAVGRISYINKTGEGFIKLDWRA